MRSPGKPSPIGIFLLQNNREDRFISGEVWVRHAFHNGADIMVDYTRSRANSNEVLDPSISALIFSPQQAGPLAWDAPNRVVVPRLDSAAHLATAIQLFLRVPYGLPV